MMRHSKLATILLITAVMLLFTACSGSQITQASAESVGEAADGDTIEGDDHHEDEEHGHRDENMTHLHVDPPQDFASLNNPIAGDHEAIEAGEETFNNLCATCHGPEGKGDGPGAVGLEPQPADLSDGQMLSSLSDGYLFWRVSMGGAMEPFNSAMPAWQSGLSEEQRWQVISYIRTLADEHKEEDGHSDVEHEEEHEEMHQEGDEHAEEVHEKEHNE